jgi:hypothetical protein
MWRLTGQVTHSTQPVRRFSVNYTLRLKRTATRVSVRTRSESVDTTPPPVSWAQIWNDGNGMCFAGLGRPIDADKKRLWTKAF